MREIEPSDFSDLVFMMGAAWTRSKYPTEKFSFLVACENVRCVLGNPLGFGVIQFVEGKPAAGMLGQLTHYICSEEYFAKELGMGVMPWARGRISLLKLIKAFEESARSRGAKEIAPLITSGFKAKSLAKAYERLGYSVDGYTLRKNLEV